MLEKIISALPAKDRVVLREQDLTPEWLETAIHQRKSLMQRDLWVGVPWFIAYSASLLLTQFSNITIGIAVIGSVYFTYTVFTTGSYGSNRKRIAVYQQLLEKLKN